MKIHPVTAEFFHANRQTDRQTDIKKLIVTFRHFAKAPIFNPVHTTHLNSI